MGTGSDFIKRQWAEIGPNAKYDFYKWALLAGFGLAATMITYVVKWIQQLRHAPQEDGLGYLILGVLVFILLVVCAIFLFRRKLTPMPVSTTEPTPSEEDSDNSISATEPLKDVDIFTEVLQLHFKENPSQYTYSIFMKLKLTNRGPISATIGSWMLFVTVGQEETRCDALGVLPTNLAVKRTDYLGMLTPPNETFEQIEPNLGELLDRFPLVRGIPQVGWVCFHLGSWDGLQPAVNAKLTIYMMDALGGTHWHVREAQNFKKSGEIVEHQAPFRITPLLGGGLMSG